MQYKPVHASLALTQFLETTPKIVLRLYFVLHALRHLQGFFDHRQLGKGRQAAEEGSDEAWNWHGDLTIIELFRIYHKPAQIHKVQPEYHF